MKSSIVRLLVPAMRRLTSRIVYKKNLPLEFGGAPIYVTTRADIRLLAPGWKGPGGDLMQVVRSHVTPGMCIWDIGSNLGILSFCAAYKVGPQGKVFSVEADPKYAEIQNRTAMRLPPGYSPMVPLCAAVADKPSLLTLVVPKNGHARNHLSVVAGNSADRMECEKAVVTVTLDFLRQHWPAPGFLKIDVEGAELLALRGATQLLRHDRPVIYVEVNQENSEEATAILKQNSYRLYSLGNDGTESEIESCVFNTVARPNVRTRFESTN